jgi:hypothetical protein
MKSYSRRIRAVFGVAALALGFLISSLAIFGNRPITASAITARAPDDSPKNGNLSTVPLPKKHDKTKALEGRVLVIVELKDPLDGRISRHDAAQAIRSLSTIDRVPLRGVIERIRTRANTVARDVVFNPQFGHSTITALAEKREMDVYEYALARFWVLVLPDTIPSEQKANIIENLEKTPEVASTRLNRPLQDRYGTATQTSFAKQTDCNLRAIGNPYWEWRPNPNRTGSALAHDPQNDGVWRDAPNGLGWGKLRRSIANNSSTTYRDPRYDLLRQESIGVISTDWTSEMLSSGFVDSNRVEFPLQPDMDLIGFLKPAQVPTCTTQADWDDRSHLVSTMSLLQGDIAGYVGSGPMAGKRVEIGAFPGKVMYASREVLKLRADKSVYALPTSDTTESERLLQMAQGLPYSPRPNLSAIYVEYGGLLDPNGLNPNQVDSGDFSWACRTESAASISYQCQDVSQAKVSGKYPSGPIDIHSDTFAAVQYITKTLNIPVVIAVHNYSVDLDSIRDYTGRWLYRPGEANSREHSGAIYVGASKTNWTETGGVTRISSALAPHDWSNTGRVIDFNSWGSNVLAAGYMPRAPGAGVGENEVQAFSGTSAATPTITVLVAYLKGMCEYNFGRTVSSDDIRYWLKETGTRQKWSPREAPVWRNIGVQPNIYNAATLAQRDRCDAGSSVGGVRPQGIVKVYLPLPTTDPLYPQSVSDAEFPEPSWQLTDAPPQTVVVDPGSPNPPSAPPQPPQQRCGSSSNPCINSEPSKPTYWGRTPVRLPGPWTDFVFDEGIDGQPTTIAVVSADEPFVRLKLRVLMSRNRQECAKDSRGNRFKLQSTRGQTLFEQDVFVGERSIQPQTRLCDYDWQWNPSRFYQSWFVYYEGAFDYLTEPGYVELKINVTQASGYQVMQFELNGKKRLVQIHVEPSKQGQSFVKITEAYKTVDHWFLFFWTGSHKEYVSRRIVWGELLDDKPFPSEYMHDQDGERVVRHSYRDFAIFRSVHHDLASAAYALLRCGENISVAQTQPDCDRLGFVVSARLIPMDKAGFENLTHQSFEDFSLIQLPTDASRSIEQGIGGAERYNPASPPTINRDSYIVFPPSHVNKRTEPYDPPNIPPREPPPEPVVDYPIIIPEDRTGCDNPAVIRPSCYAVPSQEEKRLKYERDIATVMALLDDDDDEPVATKTVATVEKKPSAIFGPHYPALPVGLFPLRATTDRGPNLVRQSPVLPSSEFEVFKSIQMTPLSHRR